ncbi:hypothetical protein CDAR_540651 [Caerostris darwini]|uniref:Uncharacterized protein n=1 Tax=Caerostris darwini TaxID=1538125 RepID=A0AAV4VNP3_9ARAC|nr:hypothetical protein CDAR_540651 [Caerostris darwini]
MRCRGVSKPRSISPHLTIHKVQCKNGATSHTTCRLQQYILIRAGMAPPSVRYPALNNYIQYSAETDLCNVHLLPQTIQYCVKVVSHTVYIPASYNTMKGQMYCTRTLCNLSSQIIQY